MFIKFLSRFAIASLIGFATITFAQSNANQAIAPQQVKSTPSIVYTDEKPNFSITAQNPEFTIKLKSNPTTGYSWFLREYDNYLIVPVKHSFEAPDKKLIGATGAELFTFRLKPTAFIVPHQTTIRMIYARPWQSSDSATQVVFRVSTQGQ